MKRNCNHCGNEYNAELRYINRGQGLYCSRSCSGKAHAQRAAAKPKEPNASCSYCSLPLYIKPSRLVKSVTGNFFCSTAHQNAAYREGIVKTGPSSSKNVNSLAPTCPSCGNTYYGKRGRCRRCHKSWVIEQWLGGNNDITLNHSRTTGLPTDTKGFVKQYLIETRGDKCEVCGFNEEAPDGRSIIQMDHINGNCFDNRPENLKLLCPNHHAMTPNYGSLNRGSGRAHRRKSN